MTQLPLITAATCHAYANREAWRKARQQAIGASDAAGLWGASQYTSPYSVWWSKISELEPDQPTIQQRVGHALEDFIAELFTEATGISVVDAGAFTIFTARETPTLACTPDRISADGQAVVELKTASFQSAAQWKDHIPLGYQIQLQHQLGVLGLDMAYIAVLINGTDFKFHQLERSDKFISQHVELCEKFWRENVLTKEAPNTDAADATARALAARYRESTPTTIDLPSELESLGEEYDSLLRINSDTDKRKAEIANRIKEFLGNAEQAMCGDNSGFTWRKNGNGQRTFKRTSKVRDERQ